MKKIVLFFLLFAVAVSFAEARYVRKLKEPDFFIPEKDRMHKPEELPKVVVLRPKQENKVDNYSEIPEYKIKYNKYVAKLAVFAKTKEMPEDTDVQTDLAKMESGDVFEVTEEASQKITAKEQKEFYTLAAQILKN